MISNKPESKRLFVGSLPYKFTEGELLSLFVTEGKVISVRIIHTRWGKSRGMGYVEFENVSDAVKAKNKYHNYRIEDRTIIVDYAQPDPFETPEGKARHQDALDRRQKRFKKPNNNRTSEQQPQENKFYRETGFNPRFTPRSDNRNSRPQSGNRYNRNSRPQSDNRDTEKRSFSKNRLDNRDSEFKSADFFVQRRGESQSQPKNRFSKSKHVRQSVFEQRNFGSRMGSKFAARSRRKKSK